MAVFPSGVSPKLLYLDIKFYMMGVTVDVSSHIKAKLDTAGTPGFRKQWPWEALRDSSHDSHVWVLMLATYIGGVVIKSFGIGMSIPQKMLGMTIPHSYHVPCPWLQSRSKAATLTPSGTTQRKRQRSSVQSAITAAGASMAGRIWWFPALWKLRWEQQAATRIAARCSPKGIA